MSLHTLFDSNLWATDGHAVSTKTTNHFGYNRVAKSSTSAVGKQHSACNTKSFALSGSVNSKPTERVSLADQYLDTMIMNDVWRTICLNTILQSQHERRRFKRSNDTSGKLRNNPSSVAHDCNAAPSKPRSISQTKSKINSTSAVSSKRACHDEPMSSDGSDSGFISSPSTPRSEINGPARSTRSQSTTGLTATISFDSSTSAGRRCLSCKSTSTTCWRHAFGGVVCNSCGLRYKKSRIICADVRCRYIPTTRDIRKLGNQDVRGKRCFICQGDVIIRMNGIKRSG